MDNSTENIRSFTKEEVLAYLKDQKDLEAAIDNIDAMGQNLPYIWCEDTKSILFYFPEKISKNGLIKRLTKYMVDNGWEKADYCIDSTLEEIMKYFNLKTKMKRV